MSQMDRVWIGFFAFMVAMLALDLGRAAPPLPRHQDQGGGADEPVWIGRPWCSTSASGFMGSERPLESTAAYTMEKALSVDNLFASSWCSPTSVPGQMAVQGAVLGRHRGAGFRGLFIAAGIALVEQFSWMVYIFGAFLIFTGVKMLLQREKELRPDKNPVIRLFRRFTPVTEEFHEDKFSVRHKGVLMATPLFLAMLFVELTHVVFAVEFIPAVLAISTNRSSSHIQRVRHTGTAFTVLRAGQRPASFHYLKYGLAAILAFVGAKMLISDINHMPVSCCWPPYLGYWLF